MRFLLDTQVFYLALTDPAVLPRKVVKLLLDETNERLMSAVTIMELAIKHGIGKISMDEKLTRQGMLDLRVTQIPFEPRHAMRMFSLPLHHRDPFDRMIIATALAEDVALVGKDREFKKYKTLKVIW